MRIRRPLLAGISLVCTMRVFLLFSFPNYCDNRAYRNITLYAYSMAPDRPTAGSTCTVPPSESPEPRRECCTAAGREDPGVAPGPYTGNRASLA